MARVATTIDVFNAIGEPKRRRVLNVLVHGERSVNDLVSRLKWPQPQVSRHLGVLRQVGLVSVRHEGRQRIYRANAGRLKPIHDWVVGFESFWKNRRKRRKGRARR